MNDMRLGDLDALREELQSMRVTLGGKDIYPGATKLSVLQRIDEQPTINAVPVVRCVECKHTREKTAYEAVYLKPECLICEHPEVSEDGWAVVSPEHFCSYGKQKEDN